MKLTPNFSLAEMTVTNTGLDNTPHRDHVGAILLTAFGMEQVRSVIGNHPCIVTSCYRSPKVNRAVGGVKNSHHALGFACDFRSPALSAREICKRIVKSGLKFDQLILERNDTLVHISFHPQLRGETLRQKGRAGSGFEKLTLK